MENPKVVLVFGRNNAGFKKLSSFVWTDKWLICLPKCHVSFKACTQLWTAFFIFRSGLSDIRINCNRIREGLLYYSSCRPTLRHCSPLSPDSHRKQSRLLLWSEQLSPASCADNRNCSTSPIMVLPRPIRNPHWMLQNCSQMTRRIRQLVQQLLRIQREISSFVTQAFVLLVSPPFSLIPFQSHMLQNDTPRPIVKATSHK
jgi:hypothetical protein